MAAGIINWTLNFDVIVTITVMSKSSMRLEVGGDMHEEEWAGMDIPDGQ